MKKKDAIRGVTFIEIILVTALIAILGAAATPFYSRFLTAINHDTTLDKVVSSIRKAQFSAMNGKNGETWGVCMSAGNIRVYSGTCVSPVASEDFDIPQSATVLGISDITFNKRGEPTSALSISITSDIDSTTILLNNAGGVEVN